MMCAGQTRPQLPQRMQTPAKRASAQAPGGRSGATDVPQTAAAGAESG